MSLNTIVTVGSSVACQEGCSADTSAIVGRLVEVSLRSTLLDHRAFEALSDQARTSCSLIAMSV